MPNRASEDSAPPPLLRIICPACGTEQELPSEDAGKCVICSKPLGAPAPAVPEQERALMQAAAAFPKQEPRPGPPTEVDEVLRTNRRLTAMLAFVPLWGLYRLAHSQEHGAQDKFALGFASALTTLLLAVGIWTLLPGAAERAAEKHTRVNEQIQILHSLAEDYRHQHGAPPDESAWQGSASAGDLRFYDPWGHLYRYEKRGEGYAIGTYGRDGVPGGAGEDADVIIEFPTSIAPQASSG